MAIPDARVNAYIGLFRAQSGGGGPISVFSGLPRYQSGQGFGDFFRGLLRRIFPIALNVGKSALGAMSEAQDSGASFKDTLRSAVRPAAKAVITGAISEIGKEQERQQQQQQQGSGRKRKHKRKTVYKASHGKRSKPVEYNF